MRTGNTKWGYHFIYLTKWAPIYGCSCHNRSIYRVPLFSFLYCVTPLQWNHVPRKPDTVVIESKFTLTCIHFNKAHSPVLHTLWELPFYPPSAAGNIVLPTAFGGQDRWRAQILSFFYIQCVFKDIFFNEEYSCIFTSADRPLVLCLHEIKMTDSLSFTTKCLISLFFCFLFLRGQLCCRDSLTHANTVKGLSEASVLRAH